MANIPIAQVPNAPQTGNSAVPLPVGAIRTPNIEYAEMVNDASYMAIGRAYENLGAAGQQAASVMGDFGLSMARASDEANLAKADSIKTDLLSKYYTETQRMPEDQWQSHWQSKYQDRLASEVGGMQMSTRDGANRRDIWLQSTQTAVNAEIYTKSNKALVERGKQEIGNYIDRAINEGRYEDAMAGYKRGATAGFWTPEQAEEGMIKIEEDQKINTMTSAIQQNPAQWRGELAKYQQEGKNPHNLRPEQVLQFRRMAEGTHAQLLDDLNNEMLNRLETESVAITDEDIEKFYTRPDIDAPRELINKMIEYRGFKYADTPEGQADQATKFSDLWQKIFSYNAEKDISMADPDTHKREYQRLISDIVTTAPEGQRKPFMDTLDGMVSKANQGQKSRTDEITRNLINQASSLAEWGQFGDAGKWKKEQRGDVTVTKPQDIKAWLNVQTKREQVINEIRGMMRDNPDLTIEQAQERFKTIVGPHLDPAASFMNKPEEEDGWWKSIMDVATWADFAMNPTANNPNVMTAGFNFGASGKAPASVRHNNAGAMWYRADSWQSKFGATFGQKLNDGLGQGNQIASFPTPVHGAAALLYQLNRPSYADKTVRGAISRWSGGNSVSSYLKVLGDAGFSPDQQVSEIMASPEGAVAFAKAMARHEAGSEYPMNDDQWQQAYQMFREA
jgi:hypothetical protein